MGANPGFEVQPQKGKCDKLGERVKQILFEGEDYVIYETVETGVRWTTFSSERADRLTPVLPALSGIRAVQTSRLKGHKSINRQLALGLKQAFDGEPEAALETLARVGRTLGKYRIAFGRVRYLSATYSVSALVCALALSDELALWLDPSASLLLKAAAFGSLGALFSVGLGLAQLEVDLDDPHSIVLTLGATRAVFGALSAVFLVLLIRADVVLGFVGPESPFGTYSLALVAGFSEHLVPELIQGLGNKIGVSEKRDVAHDANPAAD